MKYGIVANPVSGRINIEKKRELLKKVVGILGSDTIVSGLDTKSADEYSTCVKELSEKVDVLIVAGGDGTFLDALNSVDSDVVLSYLPFGTGNALRFDFGYPKSIFQSAEQIKNGRERRSDLILCDNKIKALFASVGVDGHVLMEREEYLKNGDKTGFYVYSKATAKSLLKTYKRVDAEVSVDELSFAVPNSLSLIVSKIPYYGYGLNMVPKAKKDDGVIHFLAINSGIGKIMYGLGTAFLSGNKVGDYRTGKKVQIKTEKGSCLQIHGTLGRVGTQFDFEIIPDKIKLRY